MNPFDVWLIIVGLAIGAGLAWLVMLDLRRSDDDIAAAESRAEAGWIADTLQARDIAADAEAVEEVLRLHRAYLAGLPDDGAVRPTRARAEEALAEAYDDEIDDRPRVPARAPVAPPMARPASAQTAVAPAAAAAPIPSALPPAEPSDAADAGADGETLEPAWAPQDLAAAHDALDALLHKPPPAD